MIATILPSSTCFHAVGYNERKVAKGSAHLLEMKNFDAVELMGHHTPDDLVAYLENYSSKNPRIKKARASKWWKPCAKRVPRCWA